LPTARCFNASSFVFACFIAPHSLGMSLLVYEIL
jgi:hypothetical protein